MNFFQRYVEYLKDNPKHYWFKRKLYGWGWTPATSEGWLVLVVFIFAFIIMVTPFLNLTVADATDLMRYLVEVATWIVALLLVCTVTGESPKWQWGVPTKGASAAKPKKRATPRRKKATPIG